MQPIDMEKILKDAPFDVSVIIPAKNEKRNICTCLDAVFDQRTKYSYEIIVIDSGSDDGTVELVEEYESVRLLEIEPRAFGHGRTRNMGASVSRGRYLVFLNADAIPVGTGWLDALIDPLTADKDGKLAGVFSRQLPRENCYLYMARDLNASMPAQPRRITKPGRLTSMLFSTVSAAIPKRVWLQKGFKQNIIIAEDQDWARSVLKEGFHILYRPDSEVVHSHNYTPQQLMKSKLDIARATNPFKSRFSALTLGGLLVLGGAAFKIIGDFYYIWFKTPNAMTREDKTEECKISMEARWASFTGRYKGWIYKDE